MMDDRIQELKTKGYPIIVTYLTPKQAEIMNVPMIFIPSKNKTISGLSACRIYLNSLVVR